MLGALFGASVLSTSAVAQEKAKPKAAPKKAAPAPKAKAPSPAEIKRYETAVWQVINRSGRAIDACTQRYTTEFPGRSGSVSLGFAQYSPDGARLTRVSANTKLKQGEKLELCLKAVAQSWRFPPWTGRKPLQGLDIRVAKGAKFQLLKAGEKPKKQAPPKAEKKQPGIFDQGAGFGQPKEESGGK